MLALPTANWLRPFALFVSLVLLLALLYFGRLVLIPVALALLFTFLLGPAVAVLQRRGLGRIPSTLVIVSGALLLCGGISWAVARQITGLIDAFPKYEPNIQARIASLRAGGSSSVLDKFQGIVQRLAREFEKKELRASPPPTDGEEPRPVRIVQDQSPFRLSQLWSMAGPLLGPFAAGGLIIVLVIFMLINREDMRNRLIALIGHGQLTATTHALEEASDRISRYLLMQLILNGAFGIAVSLGLLLIGVPYAPLWGFFAAVLRYIPYLGSWLSALLPIAMSLLVSDSWTQPILIAVLFLALELPINLFVEPWLYGRRTGVSEAALLVAVAFWAWLWGPVGLILASPLTACLVVLGKYVPALSFFNTLLGDRPVLDPPIRYYQRLLARDHDEAVEIAEEQSKNSSVEAVYDQVLVPALN